MLLPPTTITCPNTDVSGHILVSRYIRIRTGNSGQRECQFYKEEFHANRVSQKSITQFAATSGKVSKDHPCLSRSRAYSLGWKDQGFGYRTDIFYWEGSVFLFTVVHGWLLDEILELNLN
jgi:hypothetical protein